MSNFKIKLYISLICLYSRELYINYKVQRMDFLHFYTDFLIKYNNIMIF